MYYNLTQLQSMRCYGKIALRVAAILSAQFCTRLAAAQDWPIHTASKCRMPWPTSSASVDGDGRLKVAALDTFHAQRRSREIGGPDAGWLPLWGTCRNPHDTPARLLRINQPHVHPARQLRSKHTKQRHHLPPLLHVHVFISAPQSTAPATPQPSAPPPPGSEAHLRCSG